MNPLSVLVVSVIVGDTLLYLGVWLDRKLSFQTHIKHLQSKIKSRIGFLFHNKASFTCAAKNTLAKLTMAMSFTNSLQRSTRQTGCSLSQCHPFCHQSPIYYPPLRPVCSRWLALATYSSPNHWLQVIYKSMLGKAPLYLSSLVTIATPPRSPSSSRYISAFFSQFSAANDWNE